MSCKIRTGTGTGFYGLASNYDVLGNLGYTQNGYYLVKSSEESNCIKVGTSRGF